MQAWIAAELENADLGDRRLNARFGILLDRLSQRPNLSIPAACEGWAETEAAYRFFNNENVEPSKLLAPHREATLQRAAQQPVVLVVQDTTEVQLTRKQEKVVGPLTDENRYGLYVHPCLVLTPERIPLGLLGAKLWARDPEDFHKRLQRRYKPIEAKESYRWLQGYRQACELAARCPDTQVVNVSDSEADVYECFAEAAADSGPPKADWIVRACRDRRLRDPAGEKLYAAVAQTNVLKRLTIRVSAREALSGDASRRRTARSAREATVTVQAASVTLKAPHRLTGAKLPDLKVQAVLVREEEPPAGEAPIEWLLLTSLPIDTVADVEQIVAFYGCRWEIEVYFRVLKSGCRIEQRQLETTRRMMACITLYLIVAWRVLFVLMLGRRSPELPCEAVLGPDEWRAVYTIAKRQPPPETIPTLGEMIPLIASLGGYLGREHDGPPGPKAMWIGIGRMRDFALAWNIFGPKPPSAICV